MVIPNFLLFAWLTFGVELAVGLSLTLGLCTRLGALLGLLWSFNLALGLLSVPGEWPPVLSHAHHHGTACFGFHPLSKLGLRCAVAKMGQRDGL
ncbi:MAG: hypothetical protein U0401_16840 [Anaerolineae bacterium]